MDNDILQELKNISAKLDKIARLLEEKKSFPPKRDFFSDRKPFGKGGGRRDFDRKPSFSSGPRFNSEEGNEGRSFDRKPRFNNDGQRRPTSDGRNFSFKNKKRKRF